ncbi:hypothetical protein BH24ACT5_BH24ACT5_03770 [soil metagenome]
MVTSERQIASIALARELSELIRTALHPSGFSGGPWTFHADLPEVWMIVAVNRVRLPYGVGFTADLAVASKRILRKRNHNPNRPPSPVEWHRQHRLGSLIGDHTDRWWRVDATMPQPARTRAMQDFAVSLSEGITSMMKYSTDDQLLATWAAEEARLAPIERGWAADLTAEVSSERRPRGH